MKVVTTEIPGVLILEPLVHEDPRGYFMETWRADKFAAAGLEARFVQDNQSRSLRGALRGLHFQHPHGQVKLARVISGEVFDVVVDVRKGSPTFGKQVSATLSAANRRMLWIPEGFAHGFLTVSESAEFLYKCSDFYSPTDERGVLWNDPALAIPWPSGDPLVSAKDAKLPRLSEAKDLPLYRP